MIMEFAPIEVKSGQFRSSCTYSLIELFILYFIVSQIGAGPIVGRIIKIYVLYFGFCLSIVQSDYL